MDIVQNSIKASAIKIVIRIFADKDLDKMRIEIEDNGQGMDDELLIQVKNPFGNQTTRKWVWGFPFRCIC